MATITSSNLTVTRINSLINGILFPEGAGLDAYNSTESHWGVRDIRVNISMRGNLIVIRAEWTGARWLIDITGYHTKSLAPNAFEEYAELITAANRLVQKMQDAAEG